MASSFPSYSAAALSQEESDYLHRSIYDYFRWRFHDSESSRRQRAYGIHHHTSSFNRTATTATSAIYTPVLPSGSSSSEDGGEEGGDDADPSNNRLLLAMEQLFSVCQGETSPFSAERGDHYYPATSSASSTLSMSSASRPLLVSALLAYRSTTLRRGKLKSNSYSKSSSHNNKSRSSTSSQPPPFVFIWEDYYQALEKLLEDGKLPPDDATEPRGFLSWCVHQRWVYKHYHKNNNNNKSRNNNNNNQNKEEDEMKAEEANTISTTTTETATKQPKNNSDDSDTETEQSHGEDEEKNKSTKANSKKKNTASSSEQQSQSHQQAQSYQSSHQQAQSYQEESHLTQERIAKLDKLGFQWEVHDRENPSVANRIVVERRVGPGNERSEWKETFEKYKPILLEKPTSLEDVAKDVGDEAAAAAVGAAAIALETSHTTNTTDTPNSKMTRAFRKEASTWLAEQMDRYREWDAGFVDFPKEERDALETLGLLPDVIVNTEQSPLMDEEAVLVDGEEPESSFTSTTSPLPPRHHLMLPSMASTKDDDNGTTTRAGSDTAASNIIAGSIVPPDHGTRSPTVKGMPFEERYARLLHFRKQYGHVHVTNLLDPALARWVKKERIKYRKDPDGYPSTRKNMLEKIGFAWYPMKELSDEKRGTLAGTGTANQDLLWFKRLEDLKAFKKKFGHTNVAKSYDDQELANWVRHMKTRYREFQEGRRKFPQHRIDALIEIGFEVAKPGANKTPPLSTLKGQLNKAESSLLNSLVEQGKEGKSSSSAAASATVATVGAKTKSPLSSRRSLPMSNTQPCQSKRLKMDVHDDGNGDDVDDDGNDVGDDSSTPDVLKKNDEANLANKDDTQANSDDEPAASPSTVSSPLTNTYNSNQDKLWFQRLEDLKAFQNKFGHINVPKSYEDQELANWVRHTKTRYREYKEDKKKAFPKHRLEAWMELELFETTMPPSSNTASAKATIRSTNTRTSPRSPGKLGKPTTTEGKIDDQRPAATSTSESTTTPTTTTTTTARRTSSSGAEPAKSGSNAKALGSKQEKSSGSVAASTSSTTGPSRRKSSRGSSEKSIEKVDDEPKIKARLVLEATTKDPTEAARRKARSKLSAAANNEKGKITDAQQKIVVEAATESVDRAESSAVAISTSPAADSSKMKGKQSVSPAPAATTATSSRKRRTDNESSEANKTSAKHNSREPGRSPLSSSKKLATSTTTTTALRKNDSWGWGGLPIIINDNTTPSSSKEGQESTIYVGRGGGGSADQKNTTSGSRMDDPAPTDEYALTLIALSQATSLTTDKIEGRRKNSTRKRPTTTDEGDSSLLLDDDDARLPIIRSRDDDDDVKKKAAAPAKKKQKTAALKRVNNKDT